jgi:hypothetical protein
MPYTQFTMAGLSQHIGILLDDPGEKYWVAEEKYLAIYEALRVWGAHTNYWRERGAFVLSPSAPSPFYDLSTLLPTLRSRTWTLGQMVRDVQYMCLEWLGQG